MGKKHNPKSFGKAKSLDSQEAKTRVFKASLLQLFINYRV